MSSGSQSKIVTYDARWGVRLSNVIFPIDFRELRHALTRNGYELSAVPTGIPPPPTRIRYGGDIARKGEITVTVESDSGKVGVVGRSLQKAKVAFQELANLVETEVGVSLEKNVRFYWFIVHYRVNTGKTPRNEIAKGANNDYLTRFTELLGEDLTSFTIRLAPKNAVPDGENWFDIAIEPDVTDERSYHVGVVFRNSDKEKTERFVRDLENKILELIRIIEG